MSKKQSNPSPIQCGAIKPNPSPTPPKITFGDFKDTYCPTIRIPLKPKKQKDGTYILKYPKKYKSIINEIVCKLNHE